MRAASSSAARRAARPWGTGSVKLSCTIPSPRWAAYGLTRSRSTTLRGGSGNAEGTPHQVGRGVDVLLLGFDDPVDPAALVHAAADVAEGALVDGGDQPDVGDVLEHGVRLAEDLAGARLNDPAALELDLLAEVAGGVEDVARILQAQHAVVDVRGEDPLGGHPDRLHPLVRGDGDEVEEGVAGVGAEEVAVHVARGRHVLDGAVR